MSSQPRQKTVIGVYVRSIDTEHIPVALGGLPDNEVEEIATHFYPVSVNALGEGQVNVCGENGDIEAGDLIVTSSMPGKGMRQDDDLIRSYTVAKSRESVTFSSPDEVKMIACIYMCG
jgi:hypothetical protein